MTSDHVDDVERSTTRRSILKASLVVSTIGIGGTATGLAQTDDASDGDPETHTLTVGLVDSDDADIVSGDVTVNGETKTTAPVDGDPATIQTTFELEDGTYTVSASSELRDEMWYAPDQEVTIDGEDEALSLVLYPPGSDELEDDPDTETHTLTAALIASNDGAIVSGDVTVNGETKTTAPVDGDPAKVLTTFELEDGTYTVSASSDFHGETWRANDQEVTIDGADESVSLVLYPPGSDELEDDPDTETHSLSVYLVESSDADIVSGDVTVNGETKTTAPVDGDPTYVQASFELENGTYTVSATSEYRDEIWSSNDKEITIDGADRTLELYVYPPDSDELEDDPDGEEDTGSDGDTGEDDTGGDDDTSSDSDTGSGDNTDGASDDSDETDGENADETDGTSQDGGDSNADDTDETERANDQQQSSTADTPETDCPNNQDN